MLTLSAFDATARLHRISAHIAALEAHGADMAAWREASARHATACGCMEGGLAGALTLIASIIAIVMAEDRLWTAALGLVATFLMTGLGKAIGIGWARLQLISMERRLAAMRTQSSMNQRSIA